MKHSTTKRVLYSETDQMGFMYYGNYCSYYEVGRAEMIRDHGYTYNDLEKDGVMMPIVKVNSKFLRPAKYDDLITIETEIKFLDQLPFITFFHKLFNEENELIHKGEVTLAFVNGDTGKRCMPNDKMMHILENGFKKS